MTIYVPGKVTLRQTWQPMDPDAAAYITAVETADGQALEEKVKIAIDNFVLGCKADGIWSAIKASCILAGARTLAGALVPLVGTAPTNYNFVSGDYDRETGLVGDGSTKYLNSNRANNADPQNSKHLSAYVSEKGIVARSYVGSAPVFGSSDLFHRASGVFLTKINSTTPTPSAAQMIEGFCGASRNSASAYSWRFAGGYASSSVASEIPDSGDIRIFGFDNFSLGTARLAFYSIGEALDLASLDARVTDLINAIGVAIP